MRVFDVYFKITRRYLPFLMIYLSIFIVLTIVFSSLGSEMDVGSFTENKTNVTVIDRDGSEISQGIAGVLREKHNVIELEDDAQVVTDALYNRKVEYVVVIPGGYGDSFLRSDEIPLLQTQSVPNSYAGIYVARLLDSYLNTVKAYTNFGLGPDDAVARASGDLGESADVEYIREPEVRQDGIFYYYNYQAYTVMMLIIFGIGAVMIAFNRQPVAMRTNASALPLAKKNAGFGLSMLVMAFGSVAVFLLFGVFMYGGDMFRSGSLVCMLNTACFTVFSIALAFLIGMLAKNNNVLSATANALGLAMSFIGGVFVPKEVMGAEVLAIAKFTPTYWYTGVVEQVAGGGLDSQMTSDMAVGMGIQLLFAAALAAIALVVSKQKRKIA